ncbi:MAG: sugar ABC transporter permease [Proteobacteria bacterium]|nr:sugar ABC transporter permease [Pseudomonadota bacterium]
MNRTFRHWSLWPCLGFLLALSVYPVLQLVPMALSTIKLSSEGASWAFTPRRNFDLLLGDEVLRDAIVNTLVFVVLSVAAEMVLGFFSALFIACMPRGRTFARTIMILPILLPAVAIGSMWKLMYNFDFGLFNQMAALVGAGPINWLGDKRLALLSVVIVDIWHWTPFVFLILFAAIETLPQDVLEAGRVDGATSWQTIRLIILPLLGPALAVAALFRAIAAFKAFDQVFLLTSGGPGTATELLSLHLNRVFFEQNQLGYGSMLSLAIIGVIAGSLGVSRWTAVRADRRDRAEVAR